MSTTTYTSAGNRDARTQDASAREIQQEIQQTRSEMDRTIDKLGERLDPRNLVDGLLDMFRGNGDASTGTQISHTLKVVGESTAQAVRKHPVPALLCGAGALWWIFEQSHTDDHAHHDGGIRRGRGRVMGSPAYPVQTWRQEVPAWHERYDWSRAEGETRESWNARAEKTLRELQASAKSGAGSPSESIRHAASKVVGLSGHKRAEIHARWANLREHSGSFVDARTGEPYDSSYGEGWKHLASADAVAGDYDSDQDESWADKANESWQAIQESLSDAGSSTKERVQRIAHAISGYAAHTGKTTKTFGSSVAGTASHWAGAVGDSASAVGHYTSDAAHRATSSIASGAGTAQHQLAYGARAAKHGLEDAVRDYPLAVGAACLGLGLLAGLVIPHTRYEDDLMGEASDDFKEEAIHTGKEAIEGGKRVAAETAAAALDEAEKQGLTPRQLGESAREAAGAMKKSVAEAAERTNKGGADVADGISHVAHRAAETAKRETAKEAKKNS